MQWPRYHTPVQLELLQPYLIAHPDQEYATYIAAGLRDGFRIGFSHGNARLKARKGNHPSCRAKPEVVTERIAAELSAGRLLGPIAPAHLPLVHTSPMGLVPKPHQPNKFCLIVDLSAPIDNSVNDGIPSDFCSLRYASVDDAVAMVRVLGRGTMLAKIDIKDAYRLIPVHPDDYHLLGITWRGQTYVDRALPFGLCSAPKIFSAVADFISWVLHRHNIPHQLHYLDDFLFLGTPHSEEAGNVLEVVTKVLRMLGIPIAVHKTEGPNTVLTFLGIIIDTVNFELRLPDDKLVRLQALLQSWAPKMHCRKRELESLVGHLSHAATVVRHGRTFLRQLFSLLSRPRPGHHFIHLTAGAQADLLWWKTFLHEWNGLSFFPQASPSVEVTSDASGSFGCGAFSLNHGWFQLEWPDSWNTCHIAAKEMVPIVIAASLWGPQWHRRCVRFRSDNMAVVDVLRSRTSRDPLLMHLLRCLVFYAAVYHFDFMAEHLPGTHNIAADALSRNNLVLFSSLFPQIVQVPIPQPVRDLLVEAKPNWGSQEWTSLFKSSWIRASQRPLEQSTSQVGASTPDSVTAWANHPSHSWKAHYAGLRQ